METVLAGVIGGLYAAGVYMMMRRNAVKLAVGLALLSHAANLLIFTCVGLTRGRPPLIAPGATTPAGPVADPLAQAMVLTAIVIGFGLLVFTVVLLYRAYLAAGSSDVDELRSFEE